VAIIVDQDAFSEVGLKAPINVSVFFPAPSVPTNACLADPVILNVNSSVSFEKYGPFPSCTR